MWLLIPILFYSVIFLYIRHIYSHWRRKGFPHEKSNFSWTFIKSIYNREFYHIEAINELYQSGKERFVGFYCFFRPVLMIRDLAVARNLMENQNGYFNDTKWDYVRSYRKYNLLEKISPIFAAARLESMFQNIEKVGDHLVKHLKTVTTFEQRATNTTTSVQDSEAYVDMQLLLRIYSVNVIANLIYGLDMDAYKQNDSVFRQYMNKSSRQAAFNSYTFNRLPRRSSLTYRLRDIIRKNVELREDGGTLRKDILQLLVKFRNGNDLETKDKLNWHIENVFERDKVLSIKKMARITEYLLENGMATIASTAIFTLYEMLKQPDLMEKVRDELRAHIVGEKQQITYENLKQMKLMDLCIQETVRIYPSVPTIERTCRKPFSMPNSKLILREGKSFIIPLLAIQRDEKYFEDPLAYKPKRFIHDSNGNKGENFIGFGLGAKTCIAQNFVKLVVKYVLAKLLLNYNMDLVPTDDFEICYNDTPFIKSEEGLKVKLRPAKIKFEI